MKTGASREFKPAFVSEARSGGSSGSLMLRKYVGCFVSG
jgi:hypothetical protein